MMAPKFRWILLAGALFLIGRPMGAAEISVEGGPMDTGFNVGTFAYIHAVVHGAAGKPKRYVVFAEIQYYGTTSAASVEMDRLPQTRPGTEEFQVGWPIPAQAPTGFYTLALHVDDRIEHSPEVTKKVRGFVVYKKLAKITRVTFDKPTYDVGEPIKCEVALENVSDTDLKNLRVEISNAVYPWISLKSQGGHDVPELLISTLREHLDIPSGSTVTIPMSPAEIATPRRATEHERATSDSAARNSRDPVPESETYAIAVWNDDHTVLYDLQFTPTVTVRAPSRDLPKP